MATPHTPNPIVQKDLEIIVVDNDAITCKIQHIKLSSRFSLPISVFEQPKEAMEYLRISEEKSFLVLLDIDMPLMDGWDFLNEWGQLENKPEIKVVMLSCSINLRDKERSKTFPEVVDYFEKPLYNSHLDSLEVILSSLERQN